MDRALLASLTPMGGTLAGVRFFQPGPTFFEAMEPHAAKLLIDVGAGVGHVAAALAERGYDVRAFDTMGRTVRVFPVQLANALIYPYPRGSVTLICRPCHGPAFVEPAIEQMIDCGVSHIIYVGKPRNIASDTGLYRRRFNRLRSRVGREGEALYELENQ